MSCSRLAAVAAVAVSGPALAGIVGSPADFSLMQVGRGYIDIQNPFATGISSASIANPPVGSFLLLGGGVPNVERFLSVLEFDQTTTSSTGHLSIFSFRNEVEVDPFALPQFEYAFAGNRLEFTTDAEGSFLVTGATQGSGGGAIFFYDYADPTSLEIVPIVMDEFLLSKSFGAGSHTIVWGVLADPSGGMGDWEGVASVFVVPAPGAAALLALAGLVAGRRRRG
jgi:hypothetical protein